MIQGITASNMIIFYIVYVGDMYGPEKVNNTCRKMMHRRTMDRGFTILVNYSLLNCAYRWTCCNFVAGHSTRRQVAKRFLLKLREAVLGYISQNMSRPQRTKIHGVYEPIWNLNHEALQPLPWVRDIMTKCHSVSVNNSFLFTYMQAQLNFPKFCDPVLKGEIEMNDVSKLWRHITPHLRSSLAQLYLRTASRYICLVIPFLSYLLQILHSLYIMYSFTPNSFPEVTLYPL